MIEHEYPHSPQKQFLVKPNSANVQVRATPIKPTAAFQIYSSREKPRGNKSI